MKLGPGCGISQAAMASRGRIPINLLDDSWQFGSVFWGGTTTLVTVIESLPDPWGGNTATGFFNIGNDSAFIQEISQPFALGSEDSLVVSVFVKVYGVSSTPDDGNLRFYNQTIGTANGGLCTNGWHWDNAVASQSSTAGDGASGGVIDASGGWYRVYMTIDLVGNRAAEGWQDTDTCDVRLALWGGDAVSGHALQVAGFQLEPGTYPGPYKQKP